MHTGKRLLPAPAGAPTKPLTHPLAGTPKHKHAWQSRLAARSEHESRQSCQIMSPCQALRLVTLLSEGGLHPQSGLSSVTRGVDHAENKQACSTSANTARGARPLNAGRSWVYIGDEANASTGSNKAYHRQCQMQIVRVDDPSLA